MSPRTKRLRQLIELQQQMKAIREMRHADLRREAVAAEQEAAALMAGVENQSPIASLFGDLYTKRIGAALSRKDEKDRLAHEEAARIASEKARANVVKRYYQEALRKEERMAAEEETLDSISRQTLER